MKPILYSSTESFFSTYGIGVLSDTIKMTATRQLNGIDEIEFLYPVSGAFYNSMTLERIIKIKPDETSLPQLYRIDSISKEIDGIVTFTAKHISYDLNKNIVIPFSQTGVNATTALSNILSHTVGNHSFTAWSDISTTHDFEVKEPMSARKCFGGVEGSILDVYGGEYEFDNFTVKLHQSRGSDNGVRIAYGKNLTGLRADSSVENTYTAIFPYCIDEDNVITLSEHIIELQSASSFAIPRVRALDLSDKFGENEAMTETNLRTKANAWLAANDIDDISQNIEVNFVQLWQTKEYASIANLERVSLGDLVTVEYQKLGVSVKAKVIKTVYDCLNERYEKIELGNVRSNFAATLGKAISDINKVKNYVDQAPSLTKKIAQEQTALILGGDGGYVYFKQDANGTVKEVYFLDNPDPDLAVHVLRINYQGIGFSSSGESGPYNTAWTLDGKFNASFIKAGTLDAALIKTGSIQDVQGNTTLNLTNGLLTIKIDNSNNRFELWTNGATIYHSNGTVATSMFLSNSNKGVLTCETLFVGERDNEKIIAYIDNNGKGCITSNNISADDLLVKQINISNSNLNSDAILTYLTSGYLNCNTPISSIGFSLNDGSGEVGAFYENTSNEAILKTDCVVIGNQTFTPRQITIDNQTFYVLAT